MTAQTPEELLAKTTADQQMAANPAWSAFVSANAGSGKTRVLTNRVARLLLDNVKPWKILCITYTKAAAAEMAGRLFTLLGEWALAGDDDLRKALAELEGENAPARDEGALAEARRLFARALETPGGLKIQTIHSFCESVLKRFPLEAGVAPGFSVIEETEAAALINAAIDQTAMRANDDKALAGAFDQLNRRYPSQALRNAIYSAVVKRPMFRPALEDADGWDALRAACAAALNTPPNSNVHEIKSAVIADLDEATLKTAHDVFDAAGGNPKKFAATPIAGFFAAKALEEKWLALTRLFLTDKLEKRKGFGTKATTREAPELEPYLMEQQDVFADAMDRLLAAEAFDRSSALFTILEAVFAAYGAEKTRAAVLDYDDLIAHARRLFTDETAAWVMYKLDQGIDHILLDEAQDTSPDQWEVVEGPLDEFIAGHGARETNRTFFVVGDQKQSIYSFQGADAGLFAEKETELGKRLTPIGFKNAPMLLSFRTAAPVLEFVDQLFADELALQGVGGDKPLHHDVHRAGAAGRVELWPLAPKPDRAAAKPWDAPLDAPGEAFDRESEVAKLTNHVAATIKGWLDSGEELESQGRPIRPSDILILVQSRKALFTEINRALGRKGLAVAGADKMDLLSDPAVEDLMAYGRIALQAEDDLSLAEVLKSPFFRIGEDALFDLAHRRDKSQSLWSALCKRAADSAEWRKACDEIIAAREVAACEGPFSFFSHILESGDISGRKRLFQRLGETSREPIDEFMRQALEYEAAAPRSLQQFIAWAENNAGEISRDLDQTGDAIRVMTVHKAKGLEANIVFILDGHKLPRTDTPALAKVRTAKDASNQSITVPVFTRSGANKCTPLTAAIDEEKTRQYEEYRRLLYVAATRARDRLYICGHESGKKGANAKPKPADRKNWYALAEDAFDRLGARPDNRVEPAGALWDGEIRRLSSPQTGALEEDKTKPSSHKTTRAPKWINTPARPERAARRQSPSHLADHLEAEDAAPGAAYSPHRPVDRLLRGRTLHRLLELLPALPADQRRAGADRLINRLANGVDPSERAVWRDEVLTVLNDDAFAAAFGPNSRAEVAIAGRAGGADATPLLSGQIDRLAIEPDRILAIDYKTNRPPPAKVEDVPLAYLAQMAAYRGLLREIWPDRRVETALLWTYEARLTPLPDALLDEALARVS